MELDDETRRSVANLHDVFLTASLARRYMIALPVKNDPLPFMTSDRGRFERLWVAFLYVLVESWDSPMMSPVRDYVHSVASTDELTRVLDMGKTRGHIDKMRATRGYMFHRDRRSYMDIGRLAPIGALDYHESLHEAFSGVLLAAMKAISAPA